MKKEKYPTEWSLELLFKNTPANVKKERTRIKKAYLSFVKKWKNRTDYLKSPKVLRKALDELDSLSTNYSSNELRYLHLLSARELDNKDVMAQSNIARTFYTAIFNKLEFFNVNLSKIPKNIQSKFLKSKDLKIYKHLLEKTFAQGRHTLSEAEEKILNLKSPVSHSNWTKMTSTFISKEEAVIMNEKGRTKKIPFAQILKFLESKNKKVRDSAAKEFYRILDKHSDVAEQEINSILQNKRIDDDLRGYVRPDQSSHLGDDIDSAIVDKLVERVTKSFKISKDFYSFRAKLGGFKKLKYYERLAPVNIKIDKKYSYNDSVKLIKETFSELDSDFSEIFMKMVKNGQIDVHPKKGKTDGAFCSSGGKKQPVYVLLNHNGELKNVTTIAHEMGHAINDELVKRNENSLNVSDSLATAEIASIFMEDFVLQKVGSNTTEEEELALLVEYLDELIAFTFRQIAAYNFESELHKVAREKGFVSKEEIGLIFGKHMKSYLGPIFDLEKEISLAWVHWTHFRFFFYVYSYASGLLISKYLQAEVRKSPEFIKKVKKFLSTGGSKSPKNILKDLGVDITKASFWDTGLKEIEKDLNKAKKLAKKLGKI